jgi:hypothetical protein
MNSDECIDIISKDMLQKYDMNCNGEYHLQEYNFDDLMLNIVIFFDDMIDINETYTFIVSFSLSTKKFFEKDTILLCKEFFNDDVEILTKDIVTFLYSEFRENYQYSKIINEIIEKKDVDNQEKFHLAKYKLLKNKDMEKCCVCYDLNSIFTLCKHNLCLLCYSKIKNQNLNTIIICPICRGII